MLLVYILGLGLGVLPPTPTERTLAASLILADVDEPVAVPTAAEWPRLGLAVRTVAVEMELIPPGDFYWGWDLPESFPTAVRYIRRMREEIGDCPRLEVLGRFPSNRTAEAFCKFNRDYRRWLKTQMEWQLDRKSLYSAVIEETDDLYRYWDALYQASSEMYRLETRRKALGDLKRLLDEDFERGLMPEYVPTWRFNER